MAQLTIAPAFSASASSSASTSYPRYDVFINHRGPDCKHTFAIRLYRRLCDQGLLVFLDSEELIEGNNITSQLEAAIEGASVQVAIFSPTYTKSEWCLKELVLMVKSGATILPVFYGVEPSMVRWATKALRNLQQKRTCDPQTGELKPRYDSKTVQSWRDALKDVGSRSGFVLHGDDYELLEKVVQSVRKNVPKPPLDVAKYPTGLDEKLRDLERMVEPEPQELKPVGAKIVGIVGVGRVGKTTLAKHFFNHKRSDYDASSFLFDVRENERTGSLNYLQSQLIQELKHTEIKIGSPDQGKGELIKLGELTRVKGNLNRASSLMTLPNSFVNLTNLQHFELSGASKLETLPNSFGNLTNLRTISLSDAATLEMLPLQIFSGNLIYLNINLSESGASSLVPLPLLLPNASGIIANVYMAAGFHGDIFGDIENLYRTIDSQNVNINMSGASKLERLPPTNVFGNVRNVFITFSLSGASSLERLQLINFFGDIEKVFITVDFKNVNINMSGASSLESLMLLNFFGNSGNVYITLSGASSLERLPLPNFFGDIENVYITVDFQNVNINMSGASSLETLPIFLGNLKNVYIILSFSGAFSLERLPLPNFLGDIENLYMTIYFEHVNINMAGASSLETLRLHLPNFFGILRNLDFHLSSRGTSRERARSRKKPIALHLARDAKDRRAL